MQSISPEILFRGSDAWQKALPWITRHTKKPLVLGRSIHTTDLRNKIIRDLKHLNLINVSNDSIPIEFYDLNNIDLILSPINTSIMYLFHYSLISKEKIYFYKISQTEYKEKLSIAKSLDIKEFDLSNYKF